MRAVLMAFLLTIASCLHAAVAHEIASFYYFEDKTGRMTAEEVSQQHFTQEPGNFLNLGFSSSTFWIKFELQPHKDEDLFLSIIPGNLAYTEAFEHNGNKWDAVERNNPTLAINTIFRRAHAIYKINAQASTDSVLLKLNSKNTVLAIFSLENKTELINETISMTIRLSIFIGMLSLFCLLLFLVGIYKKDLFMLAIVLWSLQLGISRLLLGGAIPPGNLVDGATAFLTMTSVGLPLTISFFGLALLHTHIIHGKLKFCAIAITTVTVVIIILFFLNQTLLLAKLSTYWSLVPIIFLAMIPSTPYAFRRLGAALSSCIFLLAVSVLTFRCTQLGFLPSSFNVLLNPSLHIPFFVLFSIAALSKIKRTQEETEQSQKNSLVKAQQVAEQERIRQEQQQKFMLMLTHELKNSLSVLRLYIQVAQAQPPYSILAEQSVNDMDAIIERCSQVDQLEREEIQLNFKNVDLKELINQLISQNREKNRIIFDYQSIKDVLHTDLILLRTIISNLVDNALKYALADSNIAITVRHTANQNSTTHTVQGITITVQNEVAALDVPDNNLVFSKYYRGTMANRFSGSGLGLYIVKSLSLLLDGELTYSCHDNYVTFKLWIPV